MIDLETLTKYCRLSENEALHLPGFSYSEIGRYAYKDNGSSILAVAHVDVARSIKAIQKQCHAYYDEVAGLIFMSPALDDRLGMYIILELLPKLGINVDVLLTTDEEICDSTARNFVPAKEYNWMFQFDRSGTDVVLYKYETAELVVKLEAIGAVVGSGTISDISFLGHLGVAGMNFGTGYYREHTPHCHAILAETNAMVDVFSRFWQAHKDEKMPYVAIDDGYDNERMTYQCEICLGYYTGIQFSDFHDVFGCKECLTMLEG